MNKIMESMCVSFVAIPVILTMFYGLSDENADFFKKGKGVANQFQTVYKKQVYHFGVMVSDAAAIVVLSIIFILISTLIHVGIQEITLPK